MPDIILQLSQEHDSKTKEELSKILDEEVERFSKYMSSNGDWKSIGPLHALERALIKTYLVQKLTGKIDQVK